MIRTSIASLAFASSMLAGASVSFAEQWCGPRGCYEKSGHCSQYNHTDSETCNTGKDRMQCDWNWNDSSCYSSSGSGHGGNGPGHGGNGPGHGGNGPGHGGNGPGHGGNGPGHGGNGPGNGHGSSWWSDRYHRSFDKQGHCGQYNHTDKDTCNTGKDFLQCDWDHHQRSCYSSSHH